MFLGGVNFSITNVTIIFIYIVLVLCYFLNGYVFHNNDVKLIKLVHPKGGTLSVEGVNQFNYLDVFYDSGIAQKSLNFYKNKVVSYLIFLADTYYMNLYAKELKEGWLGINMLGLANLKSEYSREFHKLFYNRLCSKDLTFQSDYSFFNNIQLYYSNFLNNLYFTGFSLEFNSLKKKFTT
jgi:hypothetical protein